MLSSSMLKNEKVIPPGIEPGTLSVLDSRDNHYTMESPVVECSHSYFLTGLY